jgi:hypothetical protein
MMDSFRDDVLWLAGFLEGEGSFRYHYRQGKYAALHVSVGSRDEDVILKAASIFGVGSVAEDDLAGKPFYRWQVNGRGAYAVMVAIYPFMGTRRQQCIREAILDWRSVPVGNKWKTHCINGHELTPDNLCLYPSDVAAGRRRCLTCKKERERV